jgi:hypothetical protein
MSGSRGGDTTEEHDVDASCAEKVERVMSSVEE